LRTARLELRLPAEEELADFARVAEGGVHPPEEMPFGVAWTDAIGTPGFRDGFSEYHRGLLERWSLDDWSLELGVWASGEALGFQGLRAKQFAEHRSVTTGSWLGLPFQSRGFGAEMRAAVLELAFARLVARTAVSAYTEDNAKSRGVSEKLGYERAGEELFHPRGEPVRHLKVELTADRWFKSPRQPIDIEGLEPCLPLFGLG
jgi:RimJ/RimL family protein N-acetyltransferase